MNRLTFLLVVLATLFTAGVISSCGSETADGCDASLPCSVSTNIN